VKSAPARAARAMIDMTVSHLTVDPFTNMPIIILRDARGTLALPIWIGLIEASAIATELDKIALARPMTHDLMRNIIGECGITVERVEVYDVRDHTFYASLHLRGPGKNGRRTLDARPSDAIALALRTGARICVARKVLERTRSVEVNHKNGRRSHARELKELLESLSDDEFGKWKM
jgi:bifunctional DNase/RNase